MVRYRNKRHSSDFVKRLIATWTVLSMLLSNFATLAENTPEGSDIQTAVEEAGRHEHTEACYENILVCGQEEAESEREFQSTFAVHHHSGSCYDAAGNLSCGLIENEYYHTHNEFCRNAEGQLVCGLETRRPHEHTEDCYRTDRSLVCEKQETEGHAHNDACYRENRELVCGIEESECHTHGEECYVEQKELTCDLDENEDHIHDDSCYTVTRKLVCEKEEKTGHAHSDDCWRVTRELVCEKPEQESHFHGDSCYEETKTLICEKPTTTHHHTASCFNEQGLATCGQWEVPTFTCTEENWVEVGGHHHDESCYEKKLVCGQESEDHQVDGGDPVSADQTNPEDDLVVAKEDSDQTTDSAADASSDTDQQTDQSADGQQPEYDINIPDRQDNDTPAATVGSGTESPAEPENSNENLIPEFEINDTILAKYNGSDEVVTIPDGITQIDVRAFNGNTAIRKVILPDSVELINSSAFADCPNLEQVVLSDQSKLSLIGMAAFKNDKKLDTSFAANVAHVVENAFVGIGDEEESGKEVESTGADTGDSEESKGQDESEAPEGQEETDNQEESKDSEEEKGTEESEEPEDLDTSEEQKEAEDSEDNSEQKDSEDSEESNEQKEPEDPEKPDEQKEPEDPEASKEQEDPEASGEQNESERTIAVADDAPIQAYITFSSEAGIPEDTQFVVEESAENAGIEPQAQPVKLKSASRKAVLQKSRGAEDPSETYASIPSLTVLTEGEALPDIFLYEKTLNISLVSDGKEIEPENPEAEIKVTVILPGIEKGQQVEVRHLTDEGEILLDSTNDGEVVTFTTNSFSLFTFTSSAQKISSKTSEWLENTLFGRSKDENATLETAKIDENSLPDGFSIIDTTSSPQNSNLWLTLKRVGDIALGKLESISLYAVVDGKISALVKENVGITDILRLNLGNYSSFALVRDSGLRSKVEELGNVVLSGLMPKNGTADAVDVTDEYENFVGGLGASKDGEDDEELGGESSAKEGEAVRTLAAYDISIINDGEEYQPEDKPITVSIQDSAIATAVANGNAIELWHVLDDGTTERVENFTIDGDTVSFSATGFSVYVVTETTVEKILTAADGKVYRITVTYDGSARIPEGAELVVTEVNEDEYISSAATALGVEEEYLLYRKFLDISFVDTDGTVIEPATPVSVKIELLDVDAGADKLQVVHFGEDGAEKVDASASDNAVITFSSDSFSVFGFGNVLEPIDTVETETASVEILGFSGEAEIVGADAPEVEEGLEILGAYSLEETGKVWIKAELKEGVELTDMESVAIYSVKDSTGEDESKSLKELAGMGTITELPTTEFAVVKDTGYRHLSFSLTPDEEKTVTLDGMMPKMATAEAADVTENYTDHEFTESAPIYNEETGAESTPLDEEEGEEEQEEAADDPGEQQEAGDNHTIQRSTIAAFDISISNNSVDYQPDADHPVSVTITDERILPGSNLELWHIKDDGTEERVEDFSISTGTLSFTATGFSTYALVSTITTYYQTASGETYKITVEYGDDADLPADVELAIAEVDADDYLTATATALGADEDYVLYRKFFDISFVTTDENGEHIIEPNAPVNVTIELLDVTAGAEKLQVVHFGEDGVKKVTATATEEAVVSFTSSEFSAYGVGNVLTPIATAETDEANIEILGFGGEAQINTADAPAVEEGLEVLGSYNLSNEAEKVWIKADVKDGVELSSMESVVIYGVKEEAAEEQSEEQAEQGSEAADEQSGEQAEGQNTPQSTTQITELAAAGAVAELTVSNFALVKDTGYRHLNFEISVGGETAQAEGTEDITEQPQDEEIGDATANVIILDGMMPKNAGATAVDVTDAYADHEYVVLEEEQIEDQEQTDELNTEADGEEAPEEQPVNNDAGEETEELVVEEPQESGEEPQEEVQEQKRTTLAAFNITISNNDSEYQPDADHPISVEIRDDRITGENIELWHIKDDGSEERVEEFTVEEGRVEFTATGFSVYTIVEAPEPVFASGDDVQSLEELAQNYNDPETGGQGFYLSYKNKSKYFSSTVNSKGALEEKNNKAEASIWYFEKTDGGNTYYIYTLINNEKKYIKQKSGNEINLDSTGTPITIIGSDDNKTNTPFCLKHSTQTRYLQHSNGGGGIRFYENNNDATNSRITISYVQPPTVDDDPYNLNGKTFSIVYYNEGITGAGMLASETIKDSRTRLLATTLLVKPSVLDNAGELLVAPDIDLDTWTFESQGGKNFHITTQQGGTKKYLSLDGNNVHLIDTPDETALIKVETGTGSNAGKYNLSVGNYSLALMGGNVSNGFVSSTDKNDISWLTLVEKDNILDDEQFQVYTAKKVSVSDTASVYDGQKLIIYARIWNPNETKYEHYAIDHDGTLFRVYESGDTIQWIGSQINTALWDFTEYTYSDGTPNYYYELYNAYSCKYIAPQIRGSQVLSNGTIGINLNGRRDGRDYSTIIAWDDYAYDYAGLNVSGTDEIISTDLDNACQFYFAIMDTSETGELTTVPTVDNDIYGIKMRMINYNDLTGSPNDKATRSQSQIDFFGRDSNEPGLLSTDLKENGYPNRGDTSNSLESMYVGATKVNHLFIQSTYNAGGYFEYDSTQNYAYLPNGAGDFTVYDQLATVGGDTSATRWHGQFFAYNSLIDPDTDEPWAYDTVMYNKTDVNAQELPDSDPRKGELLHSIPYAKVDYFYAMEMEASFTQTVNGLDAWNHDIIFEFSGDDDFWLYVDGQLVLDLGGVHRAMTGKVNFCTGIVTASEKRLPVYNNGNIQYTNSTTLRQIFKADYMMQHSGATESQAEAYLDEIFSGDIFKNYSTHDMKVFYMERGAGGSNLHMRFNLASVKPGNVLLSKTLTGVTHPVSMIGEYAYQIWYKTEKDHQGNQQVVQLTPNDESVSIVYAETNRPVKFAEEYEINGLTYENVFLLKPGETADIGMPSNAIEYYIKECAVDTAVYDEVSVDGVKLTGEDITNGGTRKDFSIDWKATKERPRVPYVNNVDSDALGTMEFTKKLYKEDGVTEITDDPTLFSFRLYLGTENDSFDDLPLANMYRYYVKNPAGYYCQWDADNQQFISYGKKEENMVAADWDNVSFRTSMNGSISKIPIGYTVEIREVLFDTKYKVEERDYEVPDGYSLQKYLLNNVEQIDTDTDLPVPAQGSIVGGQTDKIVICNMKGWGLRLQKTWSDESFMESRNPAYFAVFTRNDENSLTLVPNTVQQLRFGESELYWYFKSLNNISFSNYYVREVTVTATLDENGIMTGYDESTVFMIAEGGTVRINGKQIGADSATDLDYTVSYDQGDFEEGSNIRVDTAVNTRPGIKLYKQDMEGNPLPGATFTLIDANGDYAGASSYTTGSDGLITTAYLRQDEEYTLTETSAPAGYRAASYHATQIPLKIMLHDTTVTVSGGDGSEYYVLDDTDGDNLVGTITIKNKQYTLQIKKIGYNENNEPIALAGVRFALYRQVQGRRDYYPISGFTDLTTDSNGHVTYTDSEGDTQNLSVAFSTGKLRAGTYYLSELEAAAGYQPLSSDVLFTVSPTGKVTVDSSLSPEGVVCTETDNATEVDYLITVPNKTYETATITVNKTVVGSSADIAGESAFNFTATLYMPSGNGKTVYDYDSNGFTDGKITFALSHSGTKNLIVPVGAILSVEERQNAWYTTKYQWDPETGDPEDEVAAYSWRRTVPVDGGTLTFTNTRNLVNITVKKILNSDPLTKNGTFNFTGTLTDYGVDATTGVLDTKGTSSLSSFDLEVKNNNQPSVTFAIPMGSTFTVVETAQDCYETTYNNKLDPVTFTDVLTGQTITVRNTRKTKTVKVTKTLDDETVTDSSNPVAFPFTVSLYNTDGTTPVNTYQLNGETVKTGDGNNNTTAGVASFSLSVINNETSSPQTLKVPYGAVLEVREGDASNGHIYKTTINSTIGTDESAVESTYKTINPVTDDVALAFTNELLEANVTLTISKTIADSDGPSDTDEFTFEISGLDASKESETKTYSYTKQTTTDGTNWVNGTTGTYQTDDEGKFTFNLKHHERVQITIPAGKRIYVEETSYGEYNPSYIITQGTTTSSSLENARTSEIYMNGDKVVDFTNSKGVDIVAPTGINTRHTPFLLLLLLGLMLLIGSGVAVKRRRGNDLDDGGVVAVRPAPPNKGPLVGSQPPVNAGQTTHSTQNAEDHIRWRNSVWVENNGPQKGFTPPQARASRGSCPQEKRSISCPQAKLWMTRTEPTGKRGDAG